MPRKSRVHFEGALYHVITRGNNKSHVFAEEKDKKEYLEIIKRYKKKYEFMIYAYCIMDNHAHMLIEVNVNPLSKVMQGIQQVYTQRYNRVKKRTGHAFEQRYKAILCDKDAYLLNLIKYIHQNPLRAGFKEGINYKWSSHNEYIGTQEIVDAEYLFSMLSNKKRQSRAMYIEHVISDEIIEESDSKSEMDEEIFIERKIKKDDNKMKIEADKLINKIEELSGKQFEEIYGNSKNKQISDIRKVLVNLLKNHTNLSNKDIAIKLGIGQSAVTNILNRRYNNSEYINELIRSVNNELDL